ncbi:MAG: ribonuclease P protein component [Gammaproteobacteria bacterium]|nr:MAG: ribonuclease P protein component [Gammaproteobacteria bacterium]
MYLSLASGSGFSKVYRTGSRSHKGGITVIQTPRETSPTEVGFVAGKKVGNAVARNRAKRRLREATRRVVLAPGTTYVVIADRGVVDAPFPSIVGWLENAIRDGAVRKRDE